MHYRYQPYPYYRRYYNLDPYYYRRYYSPYYNYQQNIIDSQIADVDQSVINYGDMSDVYQDANVYQLRSSESVGVGICTEQPLEETSQEDFNEDSHSQISIPL